MLIVLKGGICKKMNEETHLNQAEIKKAVKDIKEVWRKISYIINNQDWTHHAEVLFKANKKESKSHDNFRGDGISRNITIHEETLLFSCRSVCGYLYNLDKKPLIEDYLSFRTSLYYAYAVSHKFKKELKNIMSKKDAIRIFAYDYCDLI